jgi:hypothetical protein
MATEVPRDRSAYLAEQIERQKRGEPIDVEWVRAELERVKHESQRKLAASEKRLRWVVVAMAALFCAFWVARNLLTENDPKLLVPMVVIVVLAGWGFARRRR